MSARLHIRKEAKKKEEKDHLLPLVHHLQRGYESVSLLTETDPNDGMLQHHVLRPPIQQMVHGGPQIADNRGK